MKSKDKCCHDASNVRNRKNNFKNLKSEFYPSDNQIKIFNQTGKVVRRNCNGPWAGYSTEKAKADRATLINSISATAGHNKRRVSPTPWKRSDMIYFLI